VRQIALTGGKVVRTDNPADPMRFTIAEAGKYLLYCNASFVTNGSGRRAMSIAVNGTPVAANGMQGDPSHYSDLSVTTQYELAAGDYVEFHTAQDSGTTLLAFGFPGPGPECGLAKLP